MLGSVRALKYGAMVRPGESLLCDVSIARVEEDGPIACRGTARVQRPGGEEETAASGRFTMRRLVPTPASVSAPVEAS